MENSTRCRPPSFNWMFNWQCCTLVGRSSDYSRMNYETFPLPFPLLHPFNSISIARNVHP